MDNSVLLVVSRLSSDSRSILSSTSRWKIQSNYSRKLGPLLDPVTTRSVKHACGIPMLTHHDKQVTENHEPPNEMNKEDPTKRIPGWWQPFTVNLEDLEAHVLALSSERANSDSDGDASEVDTKTEAQFSYSLPQKPKEIYSARRKVWWLDISRARSSAKDVNLGTFTDTQSWYKFSPLSGIRVKPKLHRRRRMYESLQEPSKKPKDFHSCDWWEFGKYCEEWSWNHRTTALCHSDTSRIAEWAVTSSKRRDISRIIAIWIGWLVVVWFYGMPLLSARWPRPPGRREISKWTKIW